MSLYSIFLSKITDYVQKHGEEVFFCSTTPSAFAPPPKNEKNMLPNIVESCYKNLPEPALMTMRNEGRRRRLL